MKQRVELESRYWPLSDVEGVGMDVADRCEPARHWYMPEHDDRKCCLHPMFNQIVGRSELFGARSA